MTHTETRVVDRRSGGGGAALAFIVGGLLVLAAIIAWFVFSGGEVPTPSNGDINVDVQAPSLPEVNLPEAPRPQG